jgi:hypothetical protein
MQAWYELGLQQNDASNVTSMRPGGCFPEIHACTQVVTRPSPYCKPIVLISGWDNIAGYPYDLVLTPRRNSVRLPFAGKKEGARNASRLVLEGGPAKI